MVVCAHIVVMCVFYRGKAAFYKFLRILHFPAPHGRPAISPISTYFSDFYTSLPPHADLLSI